MTNLAVVERTIEQVAEAKINSKFRLTPGRLNEVFEFLKIPYAVSSRKIGKGSRLYELENRKGSVVAFNSMGDLLYSTPIAKAIQKRAKAQMTMVENFFADLNGEKKHRKARKPSLAKAA